MEGDPAITLLQILQLVDDVFVGVAGPLDHLPVGEPLVDRDAVVLVLVQVLENLLRVQLREIRFPKNKNLRDLNPTKSS